MLTKCYGYKRFQAVHTPSPSARLLPRIRTDGDIFFNLIGVYFVQPQPYYLIGWAVRANDRLDEVSLLQIRDTGIAFLVRAESDPFSYRNDLKQLPTREA